MKNVYLIASGKGGTGKSTITALLGRQLALLGKNVMLLELDCGLRSLDMMLGVSDKVLYDAGDVLLGRCKPVDAVTVVPTPTGNLHYIASPVDPAFIPKKEMLNKLIEGLSRHFDYLFIDAPAGLGEMLTIVAGSVKKALIVTNAAPVPMRDACALVSYLRKRGCKNNRLIINAFTSRQLGGSVPDIDCIIDTVGVKLIGIVPFDKSVTGEAFASGSGSPALWAAAAIAGRLEGNYTPLLSSSLK